VGVLVVFVSSLADSKAPLLPDSYPLAQGQMRGKPANSQTESAGN